MQVKPECEKKEYKNAKNAIGKAVLRNLANKRKLTKQCYCCDIQKDKNNKIHKIN